MVFRQQHSRSYLNSVKMADGESKEGDTKAEFAGGEVLQCGATDYWAIGRSKDIRDDYPSLPVPHRLKGLEVRYFTPPPYPLSTTITERERSRSCRASK